MQAEYLYFNLNMTRNMNKSIQESRKTKKKKKKKKKNNTNKPWTNKPPCSPCRASPTTAPPPRGPALGLRLMRSIGRRRGRRLRRGLQGRRSTDFRPSRPVCTCPPRPQRAKTSRCQPNQELFTMWTPSSSVFGELRVVGGGRFC